MPEPRPPKPTDTELAILAALWRRGPGTVREIQTALKPAREMGYTTVLKMLQIMTEKGLTTRDESARSHVYSAARPEEETQRGLVRDLLERAFAGSAARLAMHALSSKRPGAKELKEVRRLLDELDKRGGK